jgi:hypothetical protein
MTGRLRPTHWHTNDPGSRDVVVLLDGIALVDVIEADEAERWAKVYVRGSDHGPAIAWLSGDIRLVWAP